MAARAPKRGEQTDHGQAGYCGKCEKHMPDGPDACLGLIPGVSHACCGHGCDDRAYVVLGGPENVDADCETFRHVVLYGYAALAFFDLIAHGELNEPSA
jgi:hypothetical protein